MATTIAATIAVVVGAAATAGVVVTAGAADAVGVAVTTGAVATAGAVITVMVFSPNLPMALRRVMILEW